MRRLSPLLLLAGCTPVQDTSPEGQDVPTASTDLPVVPLETNRQLSMEALLSGTLTRRGECLYLGTGEDAPLIVWGDDVRAARLDEDDWLVNDYTTGLRFREGDMIQGGGGAYPVNADLSVIADPAPPASCGTNAVQLYDVKRMNPPPPPPPPPPPHDRAEGLAGTPVEPLSRPDVVEALFRHQFANNASGAQRDIAAVCLEVAGGDPPAQFLTRFAATAPRALPASACEFRGVRYVVKASGEPAIVHFVSSLACTGDVCEARGGYREANLSASVNRYRLEKRGLRWQVVADMIEVIS